MIHLKTFEELRLDKITWYGPNHDERKPGVKGFKGTKGYKFARHQSAKAKRAAGKKIAKDTLKGIEEPKVKE